MNAETPQYGLWIDCEFTGLEVGEDKLLEIGVVVTNGLFDVIATYAAVVSQDVVLVEARMSQDSWWSSRPAHKQMVLDAIISSSKDLVTIDQELASFTEEYFSVPTVPFGSSQSIDRQFIAKNLPLFDANLHYRNIDVSSFKELAKRYGVEEYKKTEQHRVLPDIYESIEELRYLLGRLCISSNSS